MIRVVLFLVVVGLIALGAAWLADRPGDVTIQWLGLRIETSVMVAVAAVAVIAAFAVLLWSLVGLLLRSPDLVARALANRRRARGYRAISRGLIAVGAGDARAARKHAEEAGRTAAGEPLALLLAAQSAQLSGDRATAERAFRAMAARTDTKLLGLRGLFVEAQRRDDASAARQYAEEAAKEAAALSWAGQAVLEFRCAGADWIGALAVLDNNVRAGLIDKAAYRRQRAVLLTARALATADDNPETAKTLALEAVKLAPDLVPAATLAGRLLAEAGELRKAARVLEAAWKASPHPDIADLYAHLRSGDSTRERLARVQSLTRQPEDHVEGAFAVARAAIEAEEFAIARAALAPLLAAPTQRVAMLMADLAEREGDEGRAREWMGRALRAPRDPAWTADGIVSDHWMAVSPVTGKLDAFQWKVPFAEVAGPLLEERGGVIDGPPEPREGGPSGGSNQPPVITPAPPMQAEARPATGGPSVAPVRRIEAVIPLVQVPDDPGTEPEPAANGRRGLFFR